MLDGSDTCAAPSIRPEDSIISGFRVWLTYGSLLRAKPLLSPYMHRAPAHFPGKVMRASCISQRKDCAASADDIANCTCGLRAHTTLTGAMRHFHSLRVHCERLSLAPYERRAAVVGQVRLGGTVVRHVYQYRATHAYPEAFFRMEHSEEAELQALSKAWNVPIVDPTTTALDDSVPHDDAGPVLQVISCPVPSPA